MTDTQTDTQTTEQIDASPPKHRRGLLLLAALIVLVGVLAGGLAVGLSPSQHKSSTKQAHHAPTASAVVEHLRPDGPLGVIPNQVNDGVGLMIYGGSPSCSADGQTCLAAMLNPRTGEIALLMTNNGGHSWASGTIPGPSGVPLGSLYQRQADELACEVGVCFLTTNRNMPPPKVLTPGVPYTSQEIRIRACQVDAATQTVVCGVVARYSHGLLGVSCVSDQQCILMRLRLTPLGVLKERARLYALTPGGVGDPVSQPAVAQSASCSGHRGRVRTNCEHLDSKLMSGYTFLVCSPAGCATTIGASEVLWVHPSAQDPPPGIVVTIHDLALGGQVPKLPLTNLTGPFRRARKSSCSHLLSWRVSRVSALLDGEFTWKLTASCDAGADAHREAWVATRNGVKWTVLAANPSDVRQAQTSGATDTAAPYFEYSGARWCNHKDSVCIISHFHPSPRTNHDSLAGGSLTVQRYARG